LVALSAATNYDVFANAMLVAMGQGATQSTWPDRASLWGASEFEAVVERLANTGFLANASARGLTAEFPWELGAVSAMEGPRTSLLTMSSEEPHPVLGAGLFCKLELPVALTGDEGPAIINDLNERELSTSDAPPSFGAWCLSPEGRPAYVTFVPNLLHRFKIEHNLAVWMVFRSDLARGWLER
jgi:hypothetical protein